MSSQFCSILIVCVCRQHYTPVPCMVMLAQQAVEVSLAVTPQACLLAMFQMRLLRSALPRGVMLSKSCCNPCLSQWRSHFVPTGCLRANQSCLPRSSMPFFPTRAPAQQTTLACCLHCLIPFSTLFVLLQSLCRQNLLWSFICEMCRPAFWAYLLVWHCLHIITIASQNWTAYGF